MKTNAEISYKQFFDFFLLPLSSQKKFLFVIFLALMFLALSQSLLIVFLGPFLKAMLGFSGDNHLLSLAEVLPRNIQHYIPKLNEFYVSKKKLIYLVPIGILCAAWIRNISIYFYQINTSRIALYIAKVYRDRLFSSLIKSPFLYITKNSPAEWMSILMNDVVFLQTRFSDILNSFLRDGIVILSAFVTMTFIHWQTALLLMGMTPLIAFGMGKTAQKIAYFAERFQIELAKMADHILEMRLRYAFIRAQHGEDFDFKRYDIVNNRYYNFIKKSLFVRASFAPLMEFIGFILFSAILYFVGNKHWGILFNGEDLIIFFGALGAMFRPLRNLGEQIAKFQETKGSLQKSMELVINFEQPLKDRDIKIMDDSKFEMLNSRVIDITSLKVGYTKDKETVFLKNMNLKFNKSIAIIGPSGGGKSTLVKCLAGLIDPEHWDANVPWEYFRDNVSMVSQKPFLFEDSLKSNLVYGNPDTSNISLNDLWNCLEGMNIREEVQKIPDGLDYIVRPVSVNLSGGQLQRLVIARALLRQKDIWIFDEATSALDDRNDEKIMRFLLSECKSENKLLLMVTHKLKWIEKFDEIWFVENGEVNKGTHTELMQNDRYKIFYGVTQPHLSET